MMSDHVLVLNTSFVPVNVTTVKRAMSLIFKDKAEIVTVETGNYCNYDIKSWSELSALKMELQDVEEGEEFISLVKSKILVPRVIRIVDYNRVPSRRVRLSRKNIYLRDDCTCQYCGKKFKSEDLNLDHVHPRALGGTSIWTNLVTSCYKCNNKKGGRTPEQANMKLIKKPYEPKNTQLFSYTHIEASIKYKSWSNFVSDLYWNVELEK